MMFIDCVQGPVFSNGVKWFQWLNNIWTVLYTENRNPKPKTKLLKIDEYANINKRIWSYNKFWKTVANSVYGRNWFKYLGTRF